MYGSLVIVRSYSPNRFIESYYSYRFFMCSGGAWTSHVQFSSSQHNVYQRGEYLGLPLALGVKVGEYHGVVLNI